MDLLRIWVNAWPTLKHIHVQVQIETMDFKWHVMCANASQTIAVAMHAQALQTHHGFEVFQIDLNLFMF